MQIVFTVEQINQLLNALGELPFKQATGFIEFIKGIAEPQIVEQQKAAAEAPAEGPAE